MTWRALTLLACLLLAACAGTTPVPARVPPLVLPLSLHVAREAQGEQRDWLLVVQDEGGVLRWSLFDPLGVPLARQRLEAGAWHNDGLLPPNPEARELFAALLYALVPSEALPRVYAGIPQQVGADGSRELDGRWRVAYRTPLQFDLHRREGPHYRISPLTGEEPR